MDTSTIVMIVAAAIALAVIYVKSPEAANKGLNATGSLMLEIAPPHDCRVHTGGIVPGGLCRRK